MNYQSILKTTLVMLLLTVVGNVYAQEEVIYFQDFEEVELFSLDSSSMEIEALPGWSFLEHDELFGLVEIVNNDSKYLMFESQGYEGESFVTLTLDMSAQSDLDVLMDLKYGTFDIFKSAVSFLSIRGASSNDWINIYDWSENEYKGSLFLDLEAVSVSDTLSKYSQSFTSEFQIRFGLGAVSANYIQRLLIEHIKLYVRPEVDLNLVQIELPKSSDTLSSNEVVELTVYNQGVNSITTIPLKWTVDGPGELLEFTEELNVQLSPGDSLTITSSHGFDFSHRGNYRVKVEHTVLNDTNTGNNECQSSVTKISHNLPLLEDFQNGDGGWTKYQLSNTSKLRWYWELLPNGKYGWINSDSRTYEFSALQSPVMDLSSLPSDPYLNLDIWVDYDYWVFVDYSSYFYLEVSVDSGITFQRVIDDDLQYSYGDRWYTTNSLISVRDVRLDSLAGESGVVFRFVMDGYSDGIYVDMFSVYEPYPKNVKITDISGLENTSLFTDSESVDFIIHNIGFDELTNIPITIQVDGPSGLQEKQETVDQSILRENQLIYTSKSKFDLSQVGFYDIKVFASDPLDDDPSNDTTSARVLHLDTYNQPLPFNITFDDLADTLTNLEDLPEIQGIPGLSYDLVEGSAYLLTEFYKNENSNRYAIFGARENSGRYEAYLSLTCDFQVLSLPDDSVYLSFDYSFENGKIGGPYQPEENKLTLRGSESDEWLDVFLFNDHLSDKIVNTGEINLSKLLFSNNQNFTESTQLRIGQVSGVNAEAMLFDNFKIYQKIHDIRVSSITGGDSLKYNHPLEIQLINDGFFDESAIPIQLTLSSSGANQTVNLTNEDGLGIGDTLRIEIDNPFDLTNINEFELEVLSQLESDLNPRNDTLSVGFSLIPLGESLSKTPIIYPNPFHDHLIINNRAVERVELYTIAGVKVLEHEVKTLTASLDVSKLKAGLYVVRLFTAEGQKEYKLIKE